jgi:hypothetical protein
VGSGVGQRRISRRSGSKVLALEKLSNHQYLLQRRLLFANAYRRRQYICCANWCYWRLEAGYDCFVPCGDFNYCSGIGQIVDRNDAFSHGDVRVTLASPVAGTDNARYVGDIEVGAEGPNQCVSRLNKEGFLSSALLRHTGPHTSRQQPDHRCKRSLVKYQRTRR